MRLPILVLCLSAAWPGMARAQERALDEAGTTTPPRSAATIVVRPNSLHQGSPAKLVISGAAIAGVRTFGAQRSGATVTELTDPSGRRLGLVGRPAEGGVDVRNAQGATLVASPSCAALVESSAPTSTVTWRGSNGAVTSVAVYDGATLLLQGDDADAADAAHDQPAPEASPAPSQPVEFALLPARPNPFSQSTIVRFSLPQAGRVSLGLYDLAGRRMAKLLDESRTAGLHQVEYRGRALADGRYYLKLSYTDATGQVTRTTTQSVVRLK